jgi:hypothetical protein
MADAVLLPGDVNGPALRSLRHPRTHLNKAEWLLKSGERVLRIRDVYPGSDFFHPGSRIQSWQDPGSASKSLSTKYIYIEYYSVGPFVGIATLPPPLWPAGVPPPQNQGGAHSPAGEGLGESQFRRLEKSLALCLLCDCTSLMLRWQNMYRRGGEASGPGPGN